MGMDQVVTPAFDRLLCFAATSRDVVLEGQGFHSELGQWFAKCGYYPAAHGEIPNAGSKISVSSARGIF